MTRIERRWRDALVAALIPTAAGPLPPADAVDLSAFWARFDASAPLHVRAGFRASVCVVAGALPWTLGYFRSLPRLKPAEREALLQRADRLPGVADLLEIAKIVICLGYFDDPAVDAAVRGSA